MKRTRKSTLPKKKLTTRPEPVCALYRCRLCLQIFWTTDAPIPEAPAHAWHNGDCLNNASGYADLVGVAYLGYHGL